MCVYMTRYYIQSIITMIPLIRRSCERIKEKDAKSSHIHTSTTEVDS